MAVGRDGDRVREVEDEVVGMRERDARAAAEAISLLSFFLLHPREREDGVSLLVPKG